MKIVTYNINGIKASSKKGLLDFLKSENPDIVCIQEVRAKESFASEIFSTSGQLDLFSNPSNYFDNYYKVYNCGNIPGYAGTMVLSKIKPNKVVLGLPPFSNDEEGRCITIYFNNFVLVNCYVPNGGTRLDFKMQYFNNLTRYLHELAKSYQVIFCSDANIAHTENDLSHPKECANKTGFLPIERQAMTKLLNNTFCDIVRKFYKNEKVYTWRSYRSRNITFDNTIRNNYKYRFDYILLSKGLETLVSSCDILDLEYSDHLPIVVNLDL